MEEVWVAPLLLLHAWRNCIAHNSAIEYRVQPGKWHSQGVSTSAATSRDKMNRHTSHRDSPCRLRKKFGSTFMNNAHNLYTSV